MLEGLFSQYLEVERNYSRHTILAYTRDLDAFREFALKIYEIDPFKPQEVGQVSHKMVRVWMGELMEEGLGSRSVSRKIASLSAYYRFLRKTGHVNSNPLTKLKSPKFEKKLPVFVRVENIEQLFERLSFEEGLEGQRDRAILEVFYSCGLRRAELVGLKTRDIDFANATLKVMGKGRKERIVPFGSHAGKAMKSYVSACQEEGLDISGVFFLTKAGKPVYDRLVHRVVEKYLVQLASLSKTSPHVLRHTFATHLLDRGADLNAIKEMLGHSSLAATQVYLHNTISKLKDVYSKAHPKA